MPVPLRRFHDRQEVRQAFGAGSAAAAERQLPQHDQRPQGLLGQIIGGWTFASNSSPRCRMNSSTCLTSPTLPYSYTPFSSSSQHSRAEIK